MSTENVICIRNCPLTDSIYNITKALEESSIARVRKIFAAKMREECNDEPIKKVVYIWVEWINTNASVMFTARLNHHREEALFKLDGWGQPIVTEIDEYGNPTRHDHWVVRPSSREAMQNDERLVFGNRENKEKWETYLAPAESAEDTDDEEEEEDETEKLQEEEELEEEAPILTLQPVLLEIPELKHNSPNSQLTPEPPRKTLSLLMPEPDEEDVEIEKVNQEANDAFMRENFNIVGEVDMGKADCALSKEELKKLSRGENVNIDNEYYDKISNDYSTVKKITFLNGYSICIKNKNFI
jgi:hypothetical protein